MVMNTLFLDSINFCRVMGGGAVIPCFGVPVDHR